MKLNYKLSELAKIDLEEIWMHTASQWSVNQANSYYRLIINEIERICHNPEIGRSIGDIKKQHRVQTVKSHLIIYKTDRENLYVDRILHQRMDIASRLHE